jgi:flavoprotein
MYEQRCEECDQLICQAPDPQAMEEKFLECRGCGATYRKLKRQAKDGRFYSRIRIKEEG